MVPIPPIQSQPSAFQRLVDSLSQFCDRIKRCVFESAFGRVIQGFVSWAQQALAPRISPPPSIAHAVADLAEARLVPSQKSNLFQTGTWPQPLNQETLDEFSNQLQSEGHEKSISELRELFDILDRHRAQTGDALLKTNIRFLCKEVCETAIHNAAKHKNLSIRESELLNLLKKEYFACRCEALQSLAQLPPFLVELENELEKIRTEDLQDLHLELSTQLKIQGVPPEDSDCLKKGIDSLTEMIRQKTQSAGS